MSVPKYSTYKPSGVESIGAVPSHWLLTKVKHVLASMGSGGTPDTDKEQYWADEDGFPWVAIGDMSDRDYVKSTAKTLTAEGVASKRLVVWPEGTLLFSMYASLGHVAELKIPATTNQAILSLVPKVCMTQGYLKRWFECVRPGLSEFASNNTQDNLNAEKVRNLFVACPPPEEQVAISAFLDRETAKIDALVEEQKRLIELLKEKRQAVISRAVTKGLDPNVPMQDSRVEWLEEVPAHWSLVATKRLFRVVAEPAPDDNEHELLSIYAAIGVRPRQDLEQRGNRATTQDGYWMVRKGDLIVNKLLAWMGAIGVSDYDGVTSPAYDVLRAIVPLEPRFYDYLFRCGICFTQFRRYSRGIMDMRLRLYFDELGQFVMPFPPPDEQRNIVSHLQSESCKFDSLSDEAFRAIELLQERRSALISAAVTGKIDVRGLAYQSEDAAA